MESRVDERVGGLETQVEENQTRIADQETQISQLSKTTQEALERAIAAGKLAEGKFVFESVLTDDQVRFGFNQADLVPEAAAALDAFAELVKSQDANLFVEIQGHTDAVGSEGYNLELGERRAEAVRRYLSGHHSFPLHRMSIISYGESEPIADNSTEAGRAQNRRVALVVLK